MLYHIELEFCIWLYLTVRHIKFECRQFASIFVGVMSLLELKILEIHSIPHFSDLHALTNWAEILYDFVLLNNRSNSNVVNSHQILCMLYHIELEFCIWLYLIVRHIKFECRQFGSNFVGVMSLLELEYWKYTFFRTFFLHASTY